jgi:hypothetical protein
MNNLDDFTRFNFGLDPATATEAQVITAIQPVSGKYYTYPHSTEMLEKLYSQLRKARGEGEPTGAAQTSAH